MEATLNLDIRTLAFSVALASALFSATFLGYGQRHRTYPGFRAWAIGSYLCTLGLFAILGTAIGLPILVGVLVATSCIACGFLARLAAVLRFAHHRALPRWVWALPAVYVLTMVSLAVFVEGFAIRGAVTGFFVGGIGLATSYWSWGGRSPRGPALRVLALVQAAFGLAFLARGLLWLAYPASTFFAPEYFQLAFWGVALLSEIAVNVTFVLCQTQRARDEAETSREELASALEEVRIAHASEKILRGLLPICAHCKKIRDDAGYWNEVEVYVRQRSEAEFSHGICPSCLHKHYDIELPGERARS